MFKKLRFIAIVPVFLLLSSCDKEAIGRFGWREGVTKEAESNLTLWQGSAISALLVGILIWGLTLWVIIFYRKKKNSPEFPRQTGYNVPLEIVYTIIPLIMVVVLFVFATITQNKVMAKEKPEMIVDVTAFQWNWKFGYRYIEDGPQNKVYGYLDKGTKASTFSKDKKSAQEAKESNPNGPKIRGFDPKDPYYLVNNEIEITGTKDKIPVLVVPINTRISFILASKDVVHSFWVVDFLEKRDANPFPKENNSDNELQISGINKTGAFVGHCAEMCGQYHALMNFEIRAVTKEQFRNYIKLRLSGKNDAQALEGVGEQPTAKTAEPLTVRLANK